MQCGDQANLLVIICNLPVCDCEQMNAQAFVRRTNLFDIENLSVLLFPKTKSRFVLLNRNTMNALRRVGILGWFCLRGTHAKQQHAYHVSQGRVVL